MRWSRAPAAGGINHANPPLNHSSFVRSFVFLPHLHQFTDRQLFNLNKSQLISIHFGKFQPNFSKFSSNFEFSYQFSSNFEISINFQFSYRISSIFSKFSSNFEFSYPFSTNFHQIFIKFSSNSIKFQQILRDFNTFRLFLSIFNKFQQISTNFYQINGIGFDLTTLAAFTYQ